MSVQLLPEEMGGAEARDTKRSKPARHGLPKDIYLLWRKSPEYRELMKVPNKSDWKFSSFVTSAMVGLLVVGVCVVLMAILWPIIGALSAESAWRTALLSIEALLGMVTVLIITGLAFAYTAAHRAFYERVKAAKSRAVDSAVEDLRRNPSLGNLLVLNRRQLDDYHLTSIRQQAVAFRNAQIAAAIGFAVLVLGAVLSMRQTSDAARFIAAGLSTLGTALSGYVASVFFRSYRDTSDEMKKYYEEPFYTHEILMIERLANLNKHDDLRPEIVQHLLGALDKRIEQDDSKQVGSRHQSAKAANGDNPAKAS